MQYSNKLLRTESAELQISNNITGKNKTNKQNIFRYILYRKFKLSTSWLHFIGTKMFIYCYFLENQERFYLYLVVSIGAGLLILLSFIVGRLLVQMHRQRSEAKFHQTNIDDHSLPNGFTDDISEVDADIDFTTPLPMAVPTVTVHSPATVGSVAEVVRYPLVHSHTIRRGPPADCNAPPRSLSTGSNTHYYYGWPGCPGRAPQSPTSSTCPGQRTYCF